MQDVMVAYAGKPVVFLEQDVDAPIGDRRAHWWAAYGGTSVGLPMIMVDGGHQISYGYQADFVGTYSAMIDAALARPPEAEVNASSQRVGDRLGVAVQVTNTSGQTLSFSGNSASVYAIVYEVADAGTTGQVVRAVASTPITVELPTGGTVAYLLTTVELAGVNWSQVRCVALVEYRPGGDSGPYEVLQAAMAPLPVQTWRVFAPLVHRPER